MSDALEIANSCVPSAESELPLLPHTRAILVGVARDRIQAALDEARRRAIEDAAQAAKPFDDPENRSDYERGFFEGRRHAEQEVRALLSESKT